MQFEQPSCDTPSSLEEIIDSQQTSLKGDFRMVKWPAISPRNRDEII